MALILTVSVLSLIGSIDGEHGRHPNMLQLDRERTHFHATSVTP